MTKEELRVYNRERQRKWRANLTPSKKCALLENARKRRSEIFDPETESGWVEIEKHRQKSYNYYWRKKEEARACGQEWKPKRDRGKINQWKLEQYRTNPIYNLTQRLRSRMRIAFRRSGTERTRRSMTRDLLGCSFDSFKTYIESLFKTGMNWENHGVYVSGGPATWHVDHIIPCVAFDFTKEEDMRKCFHYTNMQPMWALDNFRKSSRYNGITVRRNINA
jgi:hypothetical protein